MPVPWLAVLLLAAPSVPARAASVLCFFPFPGRSHHKLFAPIAEGLAARGHSVRYYTPLPIPHPHPNITQVVLPDFAPQVLGSIDFRDLGEMWIPTHLHTMYGKMRTLLSMVYEHPEVRQLIHSEEHFDAVVLESYFFQESNSAFVHKFGAPGVEIVPLAEFVWINELSGLLPHNSFVVDYKTLLSDDLSFFERVYNSLITTIALSTSYYNLGAAQELMDKYFDYPGWESRPPLSLLASNRSIILVNKSPYLGYPYPLAPHVKEIGGVNVLPTKPLPKDLQEFMDGAEAGVIYMSLGLNMEVSKMLSSKINHFLRAFERLPQRVLLKWESLEVGKLPKNVMTAKKFPQQDILAHSKTMLFITHGGVLSLFETTHHGVPILGIPFYGDQPKNVLWAEAVGLGLLLSPTNISERSVEWALGEMIGNNNKYREQTRRRSRLLRSPRHSPQEEAVYWIEHAIDFPNSLTPRSAHQPLRVLHQIDVTLFLALCLTLPLCFLFFKCRSTSRQKERKIKRN